MITVCIATYNGERYIGEQLKSILCQLSENDEVIVSDDNSTDLTLSIIEGFNDSRIKILHHDQPKNVKNSFFYTSLNFENALINASGDYIFLSDQDDVWKPNKVKSCLSVLQDYDLILHDSAIVDENLSLVENSYFKIINSKKGIIKNLIKNSYLGCCMAFKKDILKKALPFPNAEIPHDIWLGLIAEYYFKVYFCKENLISYRRHGANLSFSGEKSSNSLNYRLHYRLIILINFIKRLV